ncbi:MAG: hypothetical protein J6Q13_01790 [Clostridia bacterium]|nr:hypothetical protein [Clostridia bacterium]
MRTSADYKKLVEGYKFSLSILKEVDKNAYKTFMKAKKLLTEHDLRFPQIVRQLRIDFAQSNDHLECGEAQSIIVNNGIYKEVFNMSYSPINEYSFGVLHEIHSPLGVKKHFYEINPRTMEDKNEKGYIGLVLRASSLGIVNQENSAEVEVKKVYQYYAVCSDQTLEVFRQDLEKPDKYKDVLSVDLSNLNDFQVDCENMF